ncbi:hypothetical protein GCM10009826_35720 [Humibacillus xanthopallidus]
MSLRAEARAATRAVGTGTVAWLASRAAGRCDVRVSLRREVWDVSDVTGGVAEGALTGGAERCRPW